MLLLFLLWPVVGISAILSNIDSPRCTIKRPDRKFPLAMLMLPKEFKMFPWSLTIPAIKIALEKVKAMSDMSAAVKSLKTLDPEDGSCTATNYALYRGVHIYVTQMPDVVFGPICGFAVAPIARLLAFWNIPIISTGAIHYSFRKDRKAEYKTLTRVGSGHFDNVLSRVVSKLFQRYKWTEGTYIYHKISYADVVPLYCHSLGGYFTQEVEIANWPIKSYKELSSSTLSNDTLLGKFLKENIGNKAAVVILCVDPSYVRHFLLKADELNFNNGEYVFIDIDLFSSGNSTKYPWYSPKDNETENARAKRAFRSMLSVTVKTPESKKFRMFSDKVKERAVKEFNYTYDRDLINPFVSNFYDAVMLYAHALNKTLAEGGAVNNGSLITKNMWNTTFEGIGGKVTIDSMGDRVGDYSILDMDKDSGEFKVVANFLGATSHLEILQNRLIDWGSVDNIIPLSKPRCGYDNSLCPKPGQNLNIGVISTGIMGILLLVSLTAGYFVYRNIKRQAELNAMNWIIPWDQIHSTEKARNNEANNTLKVKHSNKIISAKLKQHQNQTQNPILAEDEVENCYLLPDINVQESYNSQGIHKDKGGLADGYYDKESYISLDTMSGINNDKLQNNQLFTKTTSYKGNIVALKPINMLRRIDINRQLLVQVKRVKDLNNDHICRFIGACLEPGHQFIIYEYCPKGSLEDVLAKDQITLDWMFKYSLIQDIVRGMVYLHTNLGPIGTLKSSNCLVDSRFVLKITDFGLSALRGNKTYLLESNPNLYYKSLLWTAPEFLTMANPPLEGTIKGDVYSFAIVCQEILYRKGVFYLDFDNSLSSLDKVNILKSSNKTVTFRPSLKVTHGCTEDLIVLIKLLWDEDPAVRPDFNAIKYQMRRFNKEGDSGNILDNLLSRMEQYANNLEDIVQQRTEQYLEEKKKAEDLLYSMLPKSVAHQLIKNQPVNAESYDMVTIFFSDIVGFTALSAESTAMEIIDLLNSLYTIFDSIIENYDVYKVETIGDAYMVCSGLPQLNGNLHAREIARMAIAFLSAIFCFSIPHRPDKELKLRIGIHSGPVCSGVVGLKMPRYCLFGDTVNTSSRMESNGLPLKIHISNNTMEILKTFGTFLMTERGLVDLKGKGLSQTFWLHGENDLIVDQIPEAAFLL